MKKTARNISLTICLVFIICCFASAQTPSNTENWRTFAPADEEFSVDTPAPLTLTLFGEKDERTVTRRYTNVYNGTYFFIFSDSGKNLLQTNLVRDFAKSFQKSGKMFQAGNLTGEKFEFADNENFYHTILFVKTNARSYVFQTVSPTEDNHLVGIFFAGIKIAGLEVKDFGKAEKNSAPEKISGNETATVTNQSEKNVGNGNGSGNGNGNGSSSGTNNNANLNTPTLPVQTKGANLLTKPRATYTDLARFYEITGSTNLRVTFLATGEIGAVTPVTKLPFGLTSQAINAARAIRFEPAIRNGQTINVTKQIIYSFTLY